MAGADRSARGDDPLDRLRVRAGRSRALATGGRARSRRARGGLREGQRVLTARASEGRWTRNTAGGRHGRACIRTWRGAAGTRQAGGRPGAVRARRAVAGRGVTHVLISGPARAAPEVGQGAGVAQARVGAPRLFHGMRARGAAVEEVWSRGIGRSEDEGGRT